MHGFRLPNLLRTTAFALALAIVSLHDPPMVAQANSPVFDSQRSTLPVWSSEFGEIVAGVMKAFFKGLVADPKGQDHPNPDENSMGQYIHRFGNMPVDFVVEGIGNFHWIGSRYIYSEVQGGLGIQHNFLSGHRDSVIAIRFAPAHLEMIWIRPATGADPTPGLPSEFLAGTLVGLEASTYLGPIEVGLRAYAMPQISLSGSESGGARGNTGVELYDAVYCKVPLERFFTFLPKGPKFIFRPALTYYNRGSAQSVVDRFNGDAIERGMTDRLRSIRSSWQLMNIFEMQY